LRETEEEIGLARSGIEVITSLEPVDTRATGFRVHPFLARIRAPARWFPATGEIAAVLTPAVETLADPRLRGVVELSGPSWPEPGGGERIALDTGIVVWGLTPRLLAALLPRLLARGWRI